MPNKLRNAFICDKSVPTQREICPFSFLLAGDICSLPKKPGLCMAYFPRWYYDTNKGKCEPFIYGGCMANANNFKTKDKCEETCSGIKNK